MGMANRKTNFFHEFAKKMLNIAISFPFRNSTDRDCFDLSSFFHVYCVNMFMQKKFLPTINRVKKEYEN